MSSNLVQSTDQTEQFWQLVAEQHGKVLAYGLAKYIALEITQELNVAVKPTKMQWGICYVTEYGVFFHHFPQQNIFTSVFKSQQDNGFCIGLPFNKINSWTAPEPPKNFWQRVIKKQERVLDIEGLVYELYLIEQGKPKTRSKAGVSVAHSTSSVHSADDTITAPEIISAKTSPFKIQHTNTPPMLHCKFFLDYNESLIVEQIRAHLINKEQK